MTIFRKKIRILHVARLIWHVWPPGNLLNLIKLFHLFPTGSKNLWPTLTALSEFGMGWFKKYMFSNFPNFDPLPLLFRITIEKKYVIKQWLFDFRQTALSRKAFDAFMGQTPSQNVKVIYIFVIFWRLVKALDRKQSRFSFLKRKIFLKIPVLAKINPSEIL